MKTAVRPSIDWMCVSDSLDAEGNALISGLLSPDECRQISEFYSNDEIFRSRVVMGRHGFGKGEYKYFSYPLPDIVQNLRDAVYPHLALIGNRWNEAMNIAVRYPAQH